MRDLFRYPKDLIYLNSGSVALSPTSVLERVQKEKEILENNPTEGLFGAWPKMWQVQKDLAEFFKADPRHLYLRSNVTYVMNDFIMALKLPPGSEILTSDIEYGAIVKICQHKAITEGHQVQFVSFHEKDQNPQTLTEDLLIEKLEDALTEKTKLVVLSHVMTGSGLRLPVEKMAKLLRRKGIFFAVDGAHGAGSGNLDLSQTEMDFYGTNLHKWLMGPKGSGFGYVSPAVREHLEPKFAGWTTHEIPPHFAVFGEGDEWTARWMLCSTVNFSDFYGISETIKFWNQLGPEKIFRRQKELADLAALLISEKTKWRCLSRFATENLNGPLIAFALPPALKARGFELMQYLQKEKKLVISMTMIQQEWCLRVSPHIYNSNDEIQEAARILSEL